VRPVIHRLPSQVLDVVPHHQREGVHLQLLGQLPSDPQQLPGNRLGFPIPLFNDHQHAPVLGPVGFSVLFDFFRHWATSSLSSTQPSFSGSSVSHSLSTNFLAVSSGDAFSRISPSTGFCSGTHDLATMVGDPLSPILFMSISGKSLTDQTMGL